MDLLPPTEILDTLDAIIASLEVDENRFYVAIDIAHQLRDELTQIVEQDE